MADSATGRRPCGPKGPTLRNPAASASDSHPLPPLTGKTKTIYHVTTRDCEDMCYEDRTEAMESMRKPYESPPIAWVAAAPILDNQGAVVFEYGDFIPPSILSREDIDDFDLTVPMIRTSLLFHTRQLQLYEPTIKSANKR